MANETNLHAKAKSKCGHQAVQPCKARKRTPCQWDKEPESDHNGESDSSSNISGTHKIIYVVSYSTLCTTDPPNFDYEVIIHNEQQGMREQKSFNSFSSWFTIQDRLAEAFGIHATQLHAQYRFSTDKKGDLPYNLHHQADLDSLVKYLQSALPHGQK
jgi:hypothetical protein